MIGASGIGKTAYYLYPNLEMCYASGMSFVVTDTKGDIFRNYGYIAKEYYGYHISVIDLRNPTRSDGFNLLNMVNKYMDLYKKSKLLQHKSKAEKYAKIIAKTIINSGGESQDHGQNAYFFDSAEGILASTILIICEFCEPEKRHIVSVFKLIQDLLAPSKIKGKTGFQALIDLLPPTHKARWFAGSALNSAEQAMQSVLSTAMSKLNAFLDSELEQILCFDTAIDTEKFCNEKCAVFLVLPEEDNTKYFMISLIVQQMYREILTVADETSGKLKKRAMFYLDEFGTLPKIDGAEMMFSASRSRKLSIVAIIQSFAQLNKNYGEEGGEIIVDNTQLTIFGGFAPNSKSAEVLSNAMGSYTVLSGSVTKGQGENSQSRTLQMQERQLMTPDELKAIPKGKFIVMKTGTNPMESQFRLFFKWGITFPEEYKVAEKGEREVKYADKNEVEDKIRKTYVKAETDEASKPDNIIKTTSLSSDEMAKEIIKKFPKNSGEVVDDKNQEKLNTEEKEKQIQQFNKMKKIQAKRSLKDVKG